MTRALQAFLERGFEGLVSTVEWQNSDSLKSCYRLGYLDFGNVYGVRMFGRYFFRSGRGCERYQFSVGRLNLRRSGRHQSLNELPERPPHHQRNAVRALERHPCHIGTTSFTEVPQRFARRGSRDQDRPSRD